MRTILAIALLVAMFVAPSVLAAPTNLDPNGNPDSPAAQDASAIVNGGYQLDGPGFSEIGDMNSWWVNSYKEFGGSPPPNPVGPLDGVAQYAPGLVDKDSWPGNGIDNPRPPGVSG